MVVDMLHQAMKIRPNVDFEQVSHERTKWKEVFLPFDDDLLCGEF